MVSEPTMANTETNTPPLSSPSSTIASSQTSSMESIVPLNLPIATRLTQTNYLTWKSQILPILHGYNLTKFILSLPPNPTITAEDSQISPNPDFLPWHRQDQLLLGWLRSSLTEVIQAQVVSCESTFELWNTLQRIFSNKSKARLTDPRRHIQTATKGGMNCSDYLQHMRKLADELLFIGSPINDDHLVTATLNGLGSEYLPFVTSITTATRSEQISFSELHGLLLSHESLLQGQHTTTASAAFNTYRQYNNSRGQARPVYNPNFSTSQVRSNNTSQYGNNNCKPPLAPKPNNSNVPPRSQPGPKTLCQICSKPGHPAKLCYFRYEADPNWKPSPYRKTDSTDSGFQAFATQVPTTNTDSTSWVLDSGATNHVTSDLNNLSTFFNYQGSDTLQVGSGSGLPI